MLLSTKSVLTFVLGADSIIQVGCDSLILCSYKVVLLEVLIGVLTELRLYMSPVSLIFDTHRLSTDP